MIPRWSRPRWPSWRRMPTWTDGGAGTRRQQMAARCLRPLRGTAWPSPIRPPRWRVIVPGQGQLALGPGLAAPQLRTGRCRPRRRSGRARRSLSRRRSRPRSEKPPCLKALQMTQRAQGDPGSAAAGQAKPRPGPGPGRGGGARDAGRDRSEGAPGHRRGNGRPADARGGHRSPAAGSAGSPRGSVSGLLAAVAAVGAELAARHGHRVTIPASVRDVPRPRRGGGAVPRAVLAHPAPGQIPSARSSGGPRR